MVKILIEELTIRVLVDGGSSTARNILTSFEGLAISEKAGIDMMGDDLKFLYVLVVPICSGEQKERKKFK